MTKHDRSNPIIALPTIEPVRLMVTGTREGMSSEQVDSFANILVNSFDKVEVFLHGDCVGVDEQAHYLVRDILDCRIETYPALVREKYRAYTKPDRIHVRMKPLARNKEMIARSTFCIAIPKTIQRQEGGTWHTYRHAKLAGLDVVLISRNGVIV